MSIYTENFTEDSDGTKCYWKNGRLHREEGPAKEKLNGDDDFLFISTYSSIFWPLSIIVLAFGGIFWCVLFVIRKLFNIIESFIKKEESHEKKF